VAFWGVSEVICCRSVLSKNLGISLVIIPCKVVGALGLDPFGGCNVHTSISVVEELRLMIVLKVYFLIALVGGCYGTEAGPLDKDSSGFSMFGWLLNCI
jgi:hypothetical protein